MCPIQPALLGQRDEARLEAFYDSIEGRGARDKPQHGLAPSPWRQAVQAVEDLLVTGVDLRHGQSLSPEPIHLVASHRTMGSVKSRGRRMRGDCRLRRRSDNCLIIGSAWRGSRPRSADGTEGSLDARLRSRTIPDRSVGVPGRSGHGCAGHSRVFARGINTLQQGHDGHLQPRRERPRGRGLRGPGAPAAGSFTSRFRSCTGPVADRSGRERRSFSSIVADA